MRSGRGGGYRGRRGAGAYGGRTAGLPELVEVAERGPRVGAPVHDRPAVPVFRVQVDDLDAVRVQDVPPVQSAGGARRDQAACRWRTAGVDHVVERAAGVLVAAGQRVTQFFRSAAEEAGAEYIPSVG
ncbi:hypothetical protein CXR04_09905 [Streptomyces sp. CMB-StM0423]|nr:hypothetical protein CXR04_09905 [Streptomyces sp. CMB-StM0423]